LEKDIDGEGDVHVEAGDRWEILILLKPKTALKK
jgi:hypothetical protein